MQSTFSFVILSLFCVTLGDKKRLLPSYMKMCDIEDKELTACVREQIVASLPHFTKGVPELNVPSTDPVKLDDIKINGNGLNLTFTEAAMHGLSNSELTDLKVELGTQDEAFSLTLKANFSLIAKYDIDGRILILPIKGNGDAYVHTQGVAVNIQSKLIHMKNSKGEHLKMITPVYKYDIEKTTFDLRNLFNGNKELAETTLKFANENWKQLMDELAPPAIKQIVLTVVKAINKFFSNIPITEMIKGYKERL
ncbi:hypothetical protein ACJJTC_017708 [Scirpophaga incertulas]